MPGTTPESAELRVFDLRILMQRSVSPFVNSNAARDKWPDVGIHSLRRPNRRIGALPFKCRSGTQLRADQPVGDGGVAGLASTEVMNRVFLRGVDV